MTQQKFYALCLNATQTVIITHYDDKNNIITETYTLTDAIVV
jgi:hypothetical protein